jgi:hypothetical protein
VACKKRQLKTIVEAETFMAAVRDKNLTNGKEKKNKYLHVYYHKECNCYHVGSSRTHFFRNEVMAAKNRGDVYMETKEAAEAARKMVFAIQDLSLDPMLVKGLSTKWVNGAAVERGIDPEKDIIRMDDLESGFISGFFACRKQIFEGLDDIRLSGTIPGED